MGKWIRCTLAPVALAALMLSACGDSDDEGAVTTTTSTAGPTTTSAPEVATVNEVCAELAEDLRDVVDLNDLINSPSDLGPAATKLSNAVDRIDEDLKRLDDLDEQALNPETRRALTDIRTSFRRAMDNVRKAAQEAQARNLGRAQDALKQANTEFSKGVDRASNTDLASCGAAGSTTTTSSTTTSSTTSTTSR